jgi:hypothetical protein
MPRIKLGALGMLGYWLVLVHVSYWLRWSLMNYLPGLASKYYPSNSASQVARITSMSHLLTPPYPYVIFRSLCPPVLLPAQGYALRTGSDNIFLRGGSTGV